MSDHLVKETQKRRKRGDRMKVFNQPELLLAVVRGWQTRTKLRRESFLNDLNSQSQQLSFDRRREAFSSTQSTQNNLNTTAKKDCSLRDTLCT